MASPGQIEPFLTTIRSIGFLSPHPDDVELSCAAMMRRLTGSGCRVEYYCITNGAPTPQAFERIHRLPEAYDPKAYQHRRRSESCTALDLIGIPAQCATFLDYPDLETYAHIRQLAQDLTQILSSLDAVVCCPFEGGHPDHDVLRFCLAVAAARGQQGSLLFEYASYNSLGWQVFLDSSTPDIEVVVTAEERILKAAVSEAFQSQKEDALRFSQQQERFRASDTYQQQDLGTYLRPLDRPYYETFAYSQAVVQTAIAEYLECHQP